MCSLAPWMSYFLKAFGLCAVSLSMSSFSLVPWLGAAMTPFARLLPADYGPDVNNTNRGLRVSTNNSSLPNPRFLSNELSSMEGTNTASSFMSVYVMQMGQFINHDIAHTPMFPIEGSCCPIDDQNEQCIPINISLDDPFFSNVMNPNTSLPEPVNCMTMARSMTSPDIKCSMDIERQQVSLSFHSGLAKD